MGACWFRDGSAGWLGSEICGTGDVTVSCGEVRSLGADVHIAALVMAGKLFAAGEGMGAETGLSADIVMIVVGGFGKSVLVLGSPVVRCLILWRVRWILDRDDWWDPWTEKPASVTYCPGMAFWTGFSDCETGRLQAMDARARYLGTSERLGERLLRS
jgi:hypothetical protein